MIRAAKISRFGSFWRVGSERVGFPGMETCGTGFCWSEELRSVGFSHGWRGRWMTSGCCLIVVVGGGFYCRLPRCGRWTDGFYFDHTLG